MAAGGNIEGSLTELLSLLTSRSEVDAVCNVLWSVVGCGVFSSLIPRDL